MDNQYPKLFPQPSKDDRQGPKYTLPDLRPITSDVESVSTESSITVALSKTLNELSLLKIKAMDYVVVFLKGKPSTPETIEELYDKIFNKITNGPTTTGKEKLR